MPRIMEITTPLDDALLFHTMHAREMSWDIERMTPFEVFCAQQLVPPPNTSG